MFSRIGTTESFRVILYGVGLQVLDTDGVFIIDNEFNVIYLEDRDFIYPEDVIVPETVLTALGM